MQEEGGLGLAAAKKYYIYTLNCTGAKINIGKFTGCMAYLEPIKLEFT